MITMPIMPDEVVRASNQAFRVVRAIIPEPLHFLLLVVSDPTDFQQLTVLHQTMTPQQTRELFERLVLKWISEDQAQEPPAQETPP
jgi:hypothetical protein